MNQWSDPQRLVKTTKFLDNYALEQSNWKSGQRDHESPIPQPAAVLTAVSFQRLVLVCAAQYESAQATRASNCEEPEPYVRSHYYSWIFQQLNPAPPLHCS